jgi:hypothetical protein
MVCAMTLGDQRIHTVFARIPGKSGFDRFEASQAYPGPYPRIAGSRAGIAVSGLSLEPLE